MGGLRHEPHGQQEQLGGRPERLPRRELPAVDIVRIRFRCSYSEDEQTRALGWRGHTLVEYPIGAHGCSSANPNFVARYGRNQEFHRTSERAGGYSRGAEAFGFSYGTRSGYPEGKGGVNIVVGLKATKPGIFGFRQIDLDYRIGSTSYTVRIDNGYAACAPLERYPTGCKSEKFLRALNQHVGIDDGTE